MKMMLNSIAAQFASLSKVSLRYKCIHKFIAKLN